ncbi:pyrroline-5-carboxylate reductase [Moraxella oblonga]|uniref:pyrroline-5-carboxylate reductase n=1 Tax=Moraxella oblonga TaxID=200413 RepID=UPI00082CD4D8|nr:pyrroline-5-carboxylate reductase [Moraxella oblonga]
MVDFKILNGKNIVFIGGGNMARAIVEGLLSAKASFGLDLTVGVSDKNTHKRDEFAKKGVLVADPQNAHTLIAGADVVVLCVKPQVAKEVAPSLLPYLFDKLILSVMAGIGVDKLSRYFGSHKIVRAMPNLPASVGHGATGLFANVGDDDKMLAQLIMASVGLTVWVDDEDKLHAVTAVAGSAPAYFFYILEAMIDKARQMGLDADDAKRLAVASMIGAGHLANTHDVVALRQQVTSKGGTTAMAIEVFDQKEMSNIIGTAMQACYDRSDELGKLF